MRIYSPRTEQVGIWSSTNLTDDDSEGVVFVRIGDAASATREEAHIAVTVVAVEADARTLILADATQAIGVGPLHTAALPLVAAGSARSRATTAIGFLGG